MRLLKYTDGSLNVSWYYIFQSRWLQATLPNCWSFTSTLEVYCCPKCFFQNICILQTRFGPHFSIASCPGGQRRSTSLRVGVLTRSMRTQPPQFAWVSQHIYIFTINWKILEYLVISRAQVERYKFWGQPSISCLMPCLALPTLPDWPDWIIDFFSCCHFHWSALSNKSSNDCPFFEVICSSKYWNHCVVSPTLTQGPYHAQTMYKQARKLQDAQAEKLPSW